MKLAAAAEGAGLPADRAGGTGTSDDDLRDGESAGLLIPSPAFICAAAKVVEDVRSGWETVGVVGAWPLLSDLVEAEGFNADGFRESPRAGRSTTRSGRECELNDDPDVAGESCSVAGGEEVKSGSTSGRLNRADMSFVCEAGCSCCGCGESLSESLRFASAFLFLGTSCSLKGSGVDAGAGDACWLRDRSGTGDSVTSFLFRSVSTRLSDGCRPFSW